MKPPIDADKRGLGRVGEAEGSTSLLVLNIGFTQGIDGPGQRMVVYLKGCNMTCPWCAAPELILPRREVLFYPSRLDDLQRAVAACPVGAVSPKGVRDISACCSCGPFHCVTSDNPAFELVGEEMSVSDIAANALRHRAFFGKSGGVTVGGGEPTCQFEGLCALLAELHNNGLHTAIETNGVCPDLPKVFDALDLLYIDLKHPDDAKCTEITGQGNAMVLANIRARYQSGKEMIVRIPLVPGYNADKGTLEMFGSVLAGIGPLSVELLPFHRRGEVKWQALGREMPAHDATEPSEEHVGLAREILKAHGLRVL